MRVHVRRSNGLAAVVLAVVSGGCGPTISLDSDGAEDGSSTGMRVPAGTSTATRGPSTSTGVPPGTTVAPTTGLDSGTTGTSSASSDGIGFISDDIGCQQQGPHGSWWHCTVIECDVVLQDCPRGEKCMPWANDGGDAWNAHRCTQIADPPVPTGGACVVEGSATSGIDDCELGAMCWGVDPATNEGTCISLCDPGDGAPCLAPETCAPLNEGDVPVCLSECDPLDPIACDEAEACRWVEQPATFSCLPLLGGEVLTSGGVCAGTTCDPDETCVPPNAACPGECCSPWCDLSDPGADAQCAALDPAWSCVAFFEGAGPPELADLGVCFEAP